MNVANKQSFCEVNMEDREESGKGKWPCDPHILLYIVHKKEIIELFRQRQVDAEVLCSKKEELGNELRVKDAEVMATWCN